MERRVSPAVGRARSRVLGSSRERGRLFKVRQRHARLVFGAEPRRECLLWCRNVRGGSRDERRSPEQQETTSASGDDADPLRAWRGHGASLREQRSCRPLPCGHRQYEQRPGKRRPEGEVQFETSHRKAHAQARQDGREQHDRGVGDRYQGPVTPAVGGRSAVGCNGPPEEQPHDWR